MSVWARIGEFLGSFSEGTGLAGSVTAALDPDNWLPGGHDAAFTLALVALSAKMAVADGVVTRAEVRAFRDTVEIPEGSESQIEWLFALAQQDVAGYQSYARKIRKLFADSPETLEQVLVGLFHIASADGMIHEEELGYLKQVSDIFGFDDQRFEAIAAAHIDDDDRRDPYLVLGLMPDAPNEEIRRVYRRLAAEHHPDRLIAKGVPREMTELATSRMAAINAAYEEIARRRGL